MSRYYLLKYTAAHAGCPVYLSAELNHEETEWSLFEPNPDSIKVARDYILRVTDPEIKDISFDMSDGDQPYVSQDFLDICDSSGVPYRAIPIKILLPNGRETAKKYFFFLPKANISLLDRTLSEYQEQKDLETGATQYNGIFPDVPMYEKIDKFVPKEISTPALFFCTEIFALICTEGFKESGSALAGVEYVPLDETYRYAPWESSLV